MALPDRIDPDELPRPRLAPELRDQVRADAENRPGTYRFVGPRGELLYIGKSVRVRTRLLSYFRARKGKAVEILRVARGVEWEYAPTEFEALLREFRLIRAFRPRFNVRHRRDRRFAWLKLTREPAPRLIATRRPTPDGARYFGPFPARRSASRTVKDLVHLLGLRDCPASTPIHFSDQLDLLDPPRAPRCPRAELGSCPAPCAALVSRDGYMDGVDEAAAFLSGESNAPLDRIDARVRSASRERAYEWAARWRDRGERIRALRDDVIEFRDQIAGLRFVYRVPGTPVRAYLVAGGRVRLTFDEQPSGDPDRPPRPDPGLADRLRTALDRADGHPPLPIGDDAREELFLVARWFRNRPAERARAWHPETYLEGG